MARTPYVITHGKRFQCATCRTVIYKRRDINAHQCPPLPPSDDDDSAPMDDEAKNERAAWLDEKKANEQ